MISDINIDWHSLTKADMYTIIRQTEEQNTKLREQADFEHFQLGEMKKAAGMMLDEFVTLENENVRLTIDNTKLRKLCADLRFCKRNDCLTCSHGRFCDMHFDERYVELGVEIG